MQQILVQQAVTQVSQTNIHLHQENTKIYSCTMLSLMDTNWLAVPVYHDSPTLHSLTNCPSSCVGLDSLEHLQYIWELKLKTYQNWLF